MDTLQKIARIEEQVSSLKEITEKIDRKLEDLDHRFDDNGRPGIVTRLDRVENSLKLLSRLIWVIIPAVVAGLVEILVKFLW